MSLTVTIFPEITSGFNGWRYNKQDKVINKYSVVTTDNVYEKIDQGVGHQRGVRFDRKFGVSAIRRILFIVIRRFL